MPYANLLFGFWIQKRPYSAGFYNFSALTLAKSKIAFYLFNDFWTRLRGEKK